MQVNPRKSKQKGLHFLGFTWWNPDFSTGYEESKQKIFSAWPDAKARHKPVITPPLCLPAPGLGANPSKEKA
jgi:hypothetical protein